LARGRGIGPVYWGGTLFMLLADAEIIEKSGGRKSLADCFQAVLAQGGDTAERWTLARFIQVCDAATGFGTMQRLAEAHVFKGSPIDLAPLLAKLGVQLGEYEAGVVYDDKAPLAWVRKKIM
jgi:predicted metalloprotease with PDZ domain